MQESILKAAETSEAVTCAQPLETCTPISPPLKKRKTPRYEDVEEPPRTVQDTLTTLKCEPEEYIEDVSFIEEDETYNSEDVKPELISILKKSLSERSSKCSSAQNLHGTLHVKGKIKLYLFIVNIPYSV